MKVKVNSIDFEKSQCFPALSTKDSLFICVEANVET